MADSPIAPGIARVAVITGSTRGIGFGLGREFLKRNWAVVLNGRREAAVREAVEALSTGAAGRVAGVAADVTDRAGAQALWDAAQARFGRVDIWINNAGLGQPRQKLWELSDDTIRAIVDTNLMGLVAGCRVAVRGMLAQGHGQIYNMEGFGSGGQVAPGMIVYGSTKRAVTYLTDSLARELAETPVQVCHLSPGMVVTDLLLGDGKEAERSRRIFEILADRVETVTPALVEKILANNKNGARIAWLTRSRILWRFATAGIIKRHVLDPKVTG